MTRTIDTDPVQDYDLFRIRPATLGDARAIVEYLRDILQDPAASVADIDEMFLDNHREREHLRRIETNPNGLALIAETKESEPGSKHRGNPVKKVEIIGFLTLEPARRRKIGHIVELGMSVREDWRGHGVGQALLSYSVNWARSTGNIEKICLNVFSENESALSLYRKAGFAEEGRLMKQIKIEGEYQDLILMGLIFSDH